MKIVQQSLYIHEKDLSTSWVARRSGYLSEPNFFL